MAGSGLAGASSMSEDNFDLLEPEDIPVLVQRTPRVHRVEHSLPAECHPPIYSLDVVNHREIDGKRREWMADGLKQALLVMYDDAVLANRKPLHQRDRFLFAVPVVGTGGGGNHYQTGEATKVILRALLGLLQEQPNFDVILCAYDRPTFLLAQQSRREALEDFFPSLVSHPPFTLPSQFQSAFQMTESLAKELDEGGLVLFLGSGVNGGSGIPEWTDLMDEMAVQCGLDTQTASWKSTDTLSKAELIDNRFVSQGKSLGEALTARMKLATTSLMHQLITGLRCKEVVTTNFDECYENTLLALDRSATLSVIPYRVSKVADQWLLKLHGCVTDPASIVATRGDYLRYMERKAALAGIVQAKLLTSHMLFVGFSLDDENFHKIMDSVLKARRGSATRIGITFQDLHNQFSAELWSPAIECVSMQDTPTGIPSSDLRAQANRQTEVMMDLLCLQTSRYYSGYIMDRRFVDSLTPEEAFLRDALENLWDRITPSEVAQFPVIATTFQNYGAREKPPLTRPRVQDSNPVPVPLPVSSPSLRSKIVGPGVRLFTDLNRHLRHRKRAE